MSLLPNYIHIINPKLKHIYLSFNAKGDLVIKSPKVPLLQIEQILIKKSSWIESSREKIKKKKGNVLDFSNAVKVYFLGVAHDLELIPSTCKKTKLKFNGDYFNMEYYKYDEEIFLKHINNFYKCQSQNYIPNLVNQWSSRMDLSYNSISFRKTKRQWGSCSAKNDLSFNTMLMKLPLSVIEYVVVHELSHIKHKHHQKKFWSLVEHYLPDYKERTAILKQYST